MNFDYKYLLFLFYMLFANPVFAKDGACKPKLKWWRSNNQVRAVFEYYEKICAVESFRHIGSEEPNGTALDLIIENLKLSYLIFHPEGFVMEHDKHGG